MGNQEAELLANLAMTCAMACVSGQATVTISTRGKRPTGFPRGELLSVGADGSQNYACNPVKVLAWLHSRMIKTPKTKRVTGPCRYDAVAGPGDKPCGLPVSKRDVLHYADRAPAGYRMLDDDVPAETGDMAYIGAIAGRWVRVRGGMNIIGATCDELIDAGRVLALARKGRSQLEPSMTNPTKAAGTTKSDRLELRVNPAERTI